MKVTVLGHDLSSNAVMRAHRLARAAATFADVELVGPVEDAGAWAALPTGDVPMRTVAKQRFPQFASSFLDLVALADGDVLLAAKPHLASFGAALVAGERRGVPVVLDVDDLETALVPRSEWEADASAADLRRPGSAVYAALLARASGAAAAVTAASSALAARFGGVVVEHGTDVELFDPAVVDRAEARERFGFDGPTVVFPGTPRPHKGVLELARAVARLDHVRLALFARPGDLAGAEWDGLSPTRLPLVPLPELPAVLAAADVVAVPQLDSEAARHQVPMKVFDAMAMARPIVATTVSDLPEILEGCARLVPPGDEDALAQAIEKLLAQPAEASELGRRARDRCLSRYSLEWIGARLGEVVSGVLTRAAR